MLVDINKSFFERLFILLIFFFYSVEMFSYDSEIIVITCILIFIILSYFNFNFSIYNTFYLQTLKLRNEYINYLTIKINVEKSLKAFFVVFFNKQSFVSKVLNYVNSFLNSDYSSQSSSRKVFIDYLFKDKLIFFIKQYSFVNRLKFWFILHISFVKSSMILRIFDIVNKFSKVFITNVFNLFKNYFGIEIYFENTFVFGSLFLNSMNSNSIATLNN